MLATCWSRPTIVSRVRSLTRRPLESQEVVDVGRPCGEFVGGEADQQVSGVDHAEDNQPFRRGAFGDCLVDGEDFVSG